MVQTDFQLMYLYMVTVVFVSFSLSWITIWLAYTKSYIKIRQLGETLPQECPKFQAENVPAE